MALVYVLPNEDTISIPREKEPLLPPVGTLVSIQEDAPSGSIILYVVLAIKVDIGVYAQGASVKHVVWVYLEHAK